MNPLSLYILYYFKILKTNYNVAPHMYTELSTLQVWKKADLYGPEHLEHLQAMSI